MEQQKPKCSQVKSTYIIWKSKELSVVFTKKKAAEQLKDGLSFVSQSIPFPFVDKMKLSRCYYKMKGNKINKILLISLPRTIHIKEEFYLLIKKRSKCKKQYLIVVFCKNFDFIGVKQNPIYSISCLS